MGVWVHVCVRVCSRACMSAYMCLHKSMGHKIMDVLHVFCDFALVIQECLCACETDPTVLLCLFCHCATRFPLCSKECSIFIVIDHHSRSMNTALRGESAPLANTSPRKESAHLTNTAPRRESAHLTNTAHRRESAHLTNTSLRRESAHLTNTTYRRESAHLTNTAPRKESAQLTNTAHRKESAHLTNRSVLHIIFQRQLKMLRLWTFNRPFSFTPSSLSVSCI